MNAAKLWNDSTKKWTRRLALPVLALALIASFTTYEFAKPAAARASEAAPAAAPLDADSVGALMALDKAMETLAARVTPAVVNVTVTSRTKPDSASQQIPEDMQQFFGGQGGPFGQFFGPHMQQRQGPQIEHGMGSGVVISPDGYIVTNNHVVDGAVDIRVTTSNRRILKAKLIGTDPLTDLAVIKVDAGDLASAPWGDSKAVRPGQTVLAFGNPYGFRFSVTRGIISALNRSSLDSDPRKPGEFIQTDAAINPGNSGGALVDARGQLIGINTMLYSPTGAFSGMGFAIPTQIAEPTVTALIHSGKINHGYIGISIEDVTPETAKFFDVKKAVGAVVSDVAPATPGSKPGLKTGDVIPTSDGKPVSDAGELQMETSQKQ